MDQLFVIATLLAMLAGICGVIGAALQVDPGETGDDDDDPRT